MDKKTVVQALEQIATYLEIKGENPFKVSAYRRAALALESDERSLEQIEDPTEIKGIGKGTAEIIRELKNTGKCLYLEQLAAELPEGLFALLHLPGLRGKRVGQLYRELGITDIESLRRACLEKKVRTIPGFGQKTEENLLRAIEEASIRPERYAISDVLPVVEAIEAKLAGMEGIIRFSRAGSVRRMRETVKDIDFIIATNDAELVREQILALDEIETVIANGETKVTVEWKTLRGLTVDFRLVSEAAYATALHHFTGSKEHNVKMRQIAKRRGEKISEYGVETIGSKTMKTFPSEEAFFQHFHLHYIPPEAREDQGEIEKAEAETAFPYVTDDQIVGDLHMHTTWSDGAHTIEEMVEYARNRGYEYIAITDHSEYLKVANGLTVERLKQQHEYIRRLNEKYDDITILTGIEMDILPDGTLDYDDEILKEIDVVIASIHSAFQQDRATIMKRLRAALENEHVDIIAHPTGRLLGKRDGYDVDVELLIKWAKETNTALELNSNPFRLDLSAAALKLADEFGVPIAINTDAHRRDHLSYMSYGTATARRAMLPSHTVMNTWPLKQLFSFLNRHQ